MDVESPPSFLQDRIPSKSPPVSLESNSEEEDDESTDKLYLEMPESRPSGIVEMTLHNAQQILSWPRDKKHLSEPVVIRCLPWRILILNDNSSDAAAHSMNPGLALVNKSMLRGNLGFFIQANGNSSSTAWSCFASARLTLVNQALLTKMEVEKPVLSPEGGGSGILTNSSVTNSSSTSPTVRSPLQHLTKSLEHTFYCKEDDWGFLSFISLRELFDPERGYFMNNMLKFRVEVHAEAPHGVSWDSKKYTGFVGIKNQGATCYMNSLLQALYFTNKLRHAVYKMLTPNLSEDESKNSIPIRLAEIFFDLQHNTQAVDTTQLTNSFGWDSSESILQHDVQELCRVLLENLEKKMKNGPVSDTIPNLFCGRMLSYIRCKHVDVFSNREENFYDIQLKVKDNQDIYESFKEYIAVETLDKDNLYNAGEYGMQEAEKGVIFLKFPPVLYLHLMRFQYDPMTDANFKINDCFKFPYQIDLKEYIKDKDPQQHTKYFLHAVLVHCGDYHGGHYIVYINPRGDNCWFKFDDDVVSRCSRREAIRANWGVDPHSLGRRTSAVEAGNLSANRLYSNAYMLVYIQESEKSDILCEISDCDIPQWFRERFKREHPAPRVAFPQTQHFSLRIIMNDDLKASNTYFLTDTPNKELRVPVSSTFLQLIKSIAEFIDQPENGFRIWSFKGKRKDQIHLHHAYLEQITEDNFTNRKFNRVYIELVGGDLLEHPGQSISPNECLLFVKIFDQYLNDLVFYNHLVVSRRQTMAKIIINLRESLIQDSSKSSPKSVEFHEFELLAYLEKDQGNDLIEAINLESFGANQTLNWWLDRFNLSVADNGHILVLQLKPVTILGSNPQSYSPRHCNPIDELQRHVMNYYNQMITVAFFDRELVLNEATRNASSAGSQQADNSPNVDVQANCVADHIQFVANEMTISRTELQSKYGGFFMLVHQNINYWMLANLVSEQLSRCLQLKISSNHLQLFLAGNKKDAAIRSTMEQSLKDLLQNSSVAELSVMGVPFGNGERTYMLITDLSSQSTENHTPETLLPYQCVYRRQNLYVTYRLFYQRIEILINELEAMHRVYLLYVNPQFQEFNMALSLPSKALVRDLLDKVRTELATFVAIKSAEPVQTTRLRLWETVQHRLFQQIVDETLPISDLIGEQRRFDLRVDWQPMEEFQASRDSISLRVAHYSHDVATGMHGVPFTVLLHVNDTLNTLGERIRQILAVNAKDFTKWTVSLFLKSQIQDVKPDELLMPLILSFQQKLGSLVQVWIGLEHRCLVRRSTERAIKIHN